jgi:ligand-binding SRPBCC domain-containing protein
MGAFLRPRDYSPSINELSPAARASIANFQRVSAAYSRIRVRATTTSTGLTVNAVLDTTTYDRGIKITDKQIAALEATQLHRHKFHGDWNYTLTADRAATRPT